MSMSRYDQWKLASPPEPPDDCPRHDWEYDPDKPEVESCPNCEAAAEDFAEMRAEERRHGDG